METLIAQLPRSATDGMSRKDVLGTPTLELRPGSREHVYVHECGGRYHLGIRGMKGEEFMPFISAKRAGRRLRGARERLEEVEAAMCAQREALLRELSWYLPAHRYVGNPEEEPDRILWRGRAHRIVLRLSPTERAYVCGLRKKWRLVPLAGRTVDLVPEEGGGQCMHARVYHSCDGSAPSIAPIPFLAEESEMDSCSSGSEDVGPEWA